MNYIEGKWLAFGKLTSQQITIEEKEQYSQQREEVVSYSGSISNQALSDLYQG
jgi:hypothetical protein